MNKINLNADLGESFGAYTMGNDHDLLQTVSSANIACGFHGGDPLVIQKAVVGAIDNSVSIGAHPSFPDLQGFGRRIMQFKPDELYSLMTYQIGAIMGITLSQGGKVTHVKPHGALNNMACEDYNMAKVLARAVKDIDPNLIFLAPALSELSKAAHDAELRAAEEIYADRAYTTKGTLVNRNQPGAVIHDPDEALKRVLDMLSAKGLICEDGSVLPCDIHSICVHGDTPSACESAQRLKEGLKNAGYTLSPLTEII